MEKKKILFISSTITANLMNLGITGGEVRLAEIMRGFIKDGWEVHFLTNGGGSLFCKHFALGRVINHNFNIKEESGSRLWFFFITVKLLFKIPLRLKNFNGYLYTANELLFDVIPALKLKLANKNNKWAAVVHWMPPLKFWQRKKSKFFISLLFMTGERLSVFLIKHFSSIALAVSKSTRKQLLNVGFRKDKVIAVNCGVNLKEISAIIKEDIDKKYDAVFMKRIQAVKGVFDLVDIWELVSKRKPKAKLAIIGGGVDNEQIRSFIKSKKLEKNIIFFGPIFDFKKKFTILAQSKLFILPSYEENWAIVMGEAMACGIPILAYDLPELVEVWQDNFIQIPLGNTQFFADKIVELLGKPKEINKISKKAFEFVKQYEWSKIAKEEVKIIPKLK